MIFLSNQKSFLISGWSFVYITGNWEGGHKKIYRLVVRWIGIYSRRPGAEMPTGSLGETGGARRGENFAVYRRFPSDLCAAVEQSSGLRRTLRKVAVAMHGEELGSVSRFRGWRTPTFSPFGTER